MKPRVVLVLRMISSWYVNCSCKTQIILCVFLKDSVIDTHNKSKEQCPSLEIGSFLLSNLPEKRDSLRNRIYFADYRAFGHSATDPWMYIPQLCRKFQGNLWLCILQGLHPGGPPERVIGPQRNGKRFSVHGPVLPWKECLDISPAVHQLHDPGPQIHLSVHKFPHLWSYPNNTGFMRLLWRSAVVIGENRLWI